MEIEFTDHLRQKMSERKISSSKILDVIRQPELICATYNGREERYKKFNKNYLMVITKQEAAVLIIITVHWVKKLPKV